jgi:hypothetical protein
MGPTAANQTNRPDEHLRRGYGYLWRARLTGSALAIFFVLHLEYLILPCVPNLGLARGFLVVVYPLLLGGFIVSALLRNGRRPSAFAYRIGSSPLSIESIDRRNAG